MASKNLVRSHRVGATGSLSGSKLCPYEDNAVNTHQARFALGQLVHHRLFDYRGVVFDVDPVFMGEEEWYRQVARTRPPKDRPWYHIMVDGAEQTTYVAERNLEPDSSGEPIHHPLLGTFFSGFDGDCYRAKRRGN